MSSILQQCTGMKRLAQRVVGRAAILVVLISFTGCSTFHRDFEAAAALPTTAAGIQGPWEGRWLSDVNAHTGQLRCLLTELDAGRYHARFWATYWKIFRATYDVQLNVRNENGKYLLEGESNLGKLAGGIYRYKGYATPTNFFSTYESKYDHGTFQMTRPSADE
jgi:hypothetical protein